MDDERAGYVYYRLFACLQTLAYEALDEESLDAQHIEPALDELFALVRVEDGEGSLGGEWELATQVRGITLKFALNVYPVDEDEDDAE